MTYVCVSVCEGVRGCVRVFVCLGVCECVCGVCVWGTCACVFGVLVCVLLVVLHVTASCEADDMCVWVCVRVCEGV